MGTLVGALNALAYVWVASSEALIGDDAVDWSLIHAASFVFLAGCAGLLVAEVLLRALDPGLLEALWSRSLILVLGFGLGGALTAGSLIATAAASDPMAPAFGGAALVETVALMLAAMVAGGVVGLVEGCLLAVPLAALLGLSLR